MKKIGILVFLMTFSGGSGAVLPTQAGSGPGGIGGATEFTQLLNLVELGGINITSLRKVAQQVQQLSNEMMMIQHQLKNLERIGSDPVAVINTLEQFAELVQRGNVLSYTATNINHLFGQKFPGFVEYENQQITPDFMEQKYADWSRQNRDSIVAALGAAGLHHQTMPNERDFIRQVRQQSETAGGNLSVLQAANRLAAQQGESLLRLRELTMVNTQLMANWKAVKQDKEDVSQAKWRDSIGTETRVDPRGGVSGRTWRYSR